MSRRLAWRLAQWVAVGVVLYFVGSRLVAQWAGIVALPGKLHVAWMLIAFSCVVVLVSYAVLIWTWQRTVRAWGQSLGFADATRIWFVSNLGRYVPGKVWQIGAMGVLAQRVGVSPVAAVGSSLVIAIVNVVTGVAVAVVCGVGTWEAPAWMVPLTAALAAAVVATPWLLPVAARWIGRILRRSVVSPNLPHSAVWIAAGGCTTAWLIYGAAFRLLHVALLGPTSDLLRSTAAFTGSYIIGFLVLFAPGGLGVREYMLQDLLSRLGIASGADAWLVVLASRAWLTVLEIVPGLFFLVRGRRTVTPPSKPVV